MLITLGQLRHSPYDFLQNAYNGTGVTSRGNEEANVAASYVLKQSMFKFNLACNLCKSVNRMLTEEIQHSCLHYYIKIFIIL